MATSLVIVLIILGQIYLALFYFSKPKKQAHSIRKKSTWPRNLKYTIPLLTWIVYLNLYGSDYSFLTKYSKIILVITIMVIIFLRYVRNIQKRNFD